MDQVEIKIILFQPTPGNWAADLYVNGDRWRCGQAHPTASQATAEACRAAQGYADAITSGYLPASSPR